MKLAILNNLSGRQVSAPLPLWVWLAPAALLPLAIVGPKVLLATYAVVVLCAGLRLLWRPGEPPILLFIFLYQWVQSATGALYANANGVPLERFGNYGPRYAGEEALEFASGLMLTGVLVLAFSMRVAAGKSFREHYGQIKSLVNSRPFGFWLRLYAAIWLFATACKIAAPFTGGLSVPLLTMSGIKWAGFFLLAFVAFSSNKMSHRYIFFIIFGIEFISSIGGYFSNFKDVFLFSIFSIVAANVRFRFPTIFLGITLTVFMMGLGILWTAVKSDYRDFVSGGSGKQIVLVDYQQRILELNRLIDNVNHEALSEATDDFISRLIYHKFFGFAVEKVPQTLPYSGGGIWGEAITRSFIPRVLFPDKRVINDSDLTNRYTGLGVSNAAQGTSISLGYMAEAYIDFGPIVMFIPIGALGAAIGLFYRWLLRRRGMMAVAGAALAPFALMPAHLAETSILKMIPALALTFVACFVVLNFLAPRVLGVRRRRTF